MCSVMPVSDHHLTVLDPLVTRRHSKLIATAEVSPDRSLEGSFPMECLMIVELGHSPFPL